MNIFFDVDGTIVVDQKWDTLRPGTEGSFRGIDALGHSVYLWSRRGYGHCRRIAKTFNLAEYLSGYATKPYKRDLIKLDKTDPANRLIEVRPSIAGSISLQVPVDLCVDNAGGHLIEFYGGVKVPTFTDSDAFDRMPIETILEYIHNHNFLRVSLV